ncbi:MAG: NusG domain II-containing protein [Ignavibacteriaceae bacterium]|nr:NusG domain II-containing protein [Ignavibacteriaceae bacterium]
MISRRNFLKIAGLSTVAVGAGFTTGKYIGNKKSVYFAVHGFIPADEQIISQLVAGFKNKVRSNADPVVFADAKIGEVISRFDSQLRNKAFSNNGNITYRLKRLDKQIDSDIIISDTENPVYSLNDLNYGFSNIRANIKNKKAKYLFSAEYNETDFLSSILNSNKKEVVIENEKGLVERISLDKNYKNILIDGPFGKTGLKIENGIARVHTSTCRHGICEHTFANNVGNVIACAPNKVLIKVV